MLLDSSPYLWACVALLAATVSASPAWTVGPNTLPGADKQWCDDVLGCLNITDEWYSAWRPINVLPSTRAHIGTKFLLHTRADRATDHDVEIVAEDAKTIAASTFDATKPTKFIIHGFLNGIISPWMPALADAMLDYGDYNVFRVGWGVGALPMYSLATANSRVVGLEIIYLVNWLIAEYGVDPADLHLIGHSLGAHIAGYSGETIKGIGRISGMDPAGPYYTNTAPMVRLDPTDAIYVDNIHTDADSIIVLGYGTGQPMGHVDFYPNSGHDQPGCDPATIAINVITIHDLQDFNNIFACSHDRSIYLYMNTLTSPTCNFLAHECPDYDTFTSGGCPSCSDNNTLCAHMGMRADEYVAKDRINAQFFLDTDKEDPFCLFSYQIEVLTAHPKNAEDWVIGQLKATLYDEAGLVLEDIAISDDHRRITHGVLNTFQFNSHADLARVMRLELHWSYNDQALHPDTYCWPPFCNRNLYVTTVQFSPIDDYPENKRLLHTQQYCNVDGSVVTIKDGKTHSFIPANNCTPMK